MSCSLIVLNAIENVSQTVANFLANPALFTATTVNAANLITQIELVIGSVRELPLNAQRKADIINRLTEAEAILQNTALGLTPIEQLLTVLQILQLAALKVSDRNIPCVQGFTNASPSNVFNTNCSQF
jgi:hypothetical protein